MNSIVLSQLSPRQSVPELVQRLRAGRGRAPKTARSIQRLAESRGNDLRALTAMQRAERRPPKDEA